MTPTVQPTMTNTKHQTRPTPNALRLLLALGIALTALLGSAKEAKAQTVYIEGPLAGAPAVREMRQYRKGRFHLKPMFGFTLQDEYSRSLIFGAQAGYYFTDWIGLDVFFGYSGVSFDTDLTSEVKRQGQTTDVNALSLPSRDNFGSQIGQMNWLTGAQLTFIPLRGKLAMFQKLFVDTDFYIFGGVGIVGVEERANVTDPQVCATAPPAGADDSDPCIATQLARSSRIAVAPTFGVGLTMYINEWAGMFLEWRGLPFAWNTSGTDEGGSEDGQFPDDLINGDDRIFHFNHMMTVGATFAFPLKANVTE